MKKRDKYFDFTGSYALIVGGATGLGKEISRALLQNGCEIIIASRNQENLNSTKIFYLTLQKKLIIDIISYSYV